MRIAPIEILIMPFDYTPNVLCLFKHKMVGCKKNGKEDVFVEEMSIVSDNAIGTFLTEK